MDVDGEPKEPRRLWFIVVGAVALAMLAVIATNSMAERREADERRADEAARCAADYLRDWGYPDDMSFVNSAIDLCTR